ncbi:MAG: hypothetical protein K2M22_07830, partial [Lachnospiraceae bacterium]|nr:hypothetical protein [Lachnospiraceae bacterium]
CGIPPCGVFGSGSCTTPGGEGGSVSGNTPGGEGGSVSENTPGDGGSGNTPGSGNESPGNNSGDQPPSQGNVIQGYEYAPLENNYQYRVKIEVKVAGFNGGRGAHQGILSTPVIIKTAQVLPKVKTDKSTLDVFLSNKQYDATFTVIPQEGVAGIVDEIKFDDDDKVSQESFDISYIVQSNGSLKVIVHLKEAVGYSCDSTNKVKMYIRFKGQGIHTAGTLINMNIRVNK